MLGVDETAFLKATATSPTRFATTGLVDLAPAGGGPARLLDVVEGRSGRVLSDWIDAQGEAFTRGVQVAALDPFRGYHTALTSRLEYATAVLDPFHVVRLLTSAADEVRRRVQNDTLGHRGRKGDLLYGIRRVLLRGAERHTPASWARLLAGVDAGDSGGQLAQVWIALQDLRHVYGAVSIDQARHRLHRFYWRCATAGVPGADPRRPHHLRLAGRAARLLHHRRCVQRTHRSGQPADQEDQKGRLRVPKLRQLPAAATAALRHHLARSVHNTDPRTQTTFYVVEPLFVPHGALALAQSVLLLYGLFAVKGEFGGSGMVGHAAVAALASRIRRW